MNPAKYELHEFLLTAENELHDSMRELPRIREFIEDLPKTAGSFRLKQIDDLYQPSYDDVHMEFLKCWPMHDIYAPSAERVYVNPNSVHAHTYTDVVIECDCGAVLSRNYEDAHNSLRNEHEHSDGCLPHWRLRARSEMTKKRYHLMHRLGRLGWKGSEMAPRLGAQTQAMGPYANQFNTTIGEMYAPYRKLAGNTYRYLVHYADETGETVASIYGHQEQTLRKWAREYAEVPLPDALTTNSDE